MTSSSGELENGRRSLSAGASAAGSRADVLAREEPTRVETDEVVGIDAPQSETESKSEVGTTVMEVKHGKDQMEEIDEGEDQDAVGCVLNEDDASQASAKAGSSSGTREGKKARVEKRLEGIRAGTDLGERSSGFGAGVGGSGDLSFDVSGFLPTLLSILRKDIEVEFLQF